VDLENEQYERIVELRKRGRAVYYCAPGFVERRHLEDHYQKRTVCPASVWVDVLPAGLLKNNKHHSIIFDQWGSVAFRCSGEPIALQVVNRETFAQGKAASEFTVDEAATLYADLWTIASERSARRPKRSPHAVDVRRTLPPRHEFNTAEDGAVEIAILA